VVPTTLKVVIEEFVGGPDHPESGDRGVCGWSRPPWKWWSRGLWVVLTRTKQVIEEFVGGLDQGQTG